MSYRFRHTQSDSTFFDLEIFDNNKYIRFLAFPKDGDYQGRKLYDMFYHIAEHFRYQMQYTSDFSLIKMERCKEGVYFHIDSYLYSLLENFATTKEWKKL